MARADRWADIHTNSPPVDPLYATEFAPAGQAVPICAIGPGEFIKTSARQNCNHALQRIVGKACTRYVIGQLCAILGRQRNASLRSLVVSDTHLGCSDVQRLQRIQPNLPGIAIVFVEGNVSPFAKRRRRRCWRPRRQGGRRRGRGNRAYGKPAKRIAAPVGVELSVAVPSDSRVAVPSVDGTPWASQTMCTLVASIIPCATAHQRCRRVALRLRRGHEHVLLVTSGWRPNKRVHSRNRLRA